MRKIEGTLNYAMMRLADAWTDLVQSIKQELKWMIAYRLDKNETRYCWVDLVMWALDDQRDIRDLVCDVGKNAGQCARMNTYPYCGKCAVTGIHHETNPDAPLEPGDRHRDDKPIIVCLCGSTKFSDAFRDANLRETLAGKIVLSIGCDMKSDDEIWSHMTTEEIQQIKADLDRLHLRKIDLADEVLILNVDGYIGESTQRELNYARQLGKPIRYLELPIVGRGRCE